MTDINQRADSKINLLPLEESAPKSPDSLATPFVFPKPLSYADSVLSNQKIEIVFAQGHRLCLEGSFDLESLKSLLTPLLAQEIIKDKIGSAS